MSTLGQLEDAPPNSIDQLRARLTDLEGEVVQLKAKPAPPLDAESMLEDATDGFLVYDSEFQFTYLNGDGERLLGKPKQTLAAHPLNQIGSESSHCGTRSRSSNRSISSPPVASSNSRQRNR